MRILSDESRHQTFVSAYEELVNSKDQCNVASATEAFIGR